MSRMRTTSSKPIDFIGTHFILQVSTLVAGGWSGSRRDTNEFALAGMRFMV